MPVTLAQGAETRERTGSLQTTGLYVDTASNDHAQKTKTEEEGRGRGIESWKTRGV